MEPPCPGILSAAFGREHGNPPLCACGAFLPAASVQRVQAICHTFRAGSLPKPVLLQLTQGLPPLEQGYLRWLLLFNQPVSHEVDLGLLPRGRCKFCQHRFLCLEGGVCSWCVRAPRKAVCP